MRYQKRVRWQKPRADSDNHRDNSNRGWRWIDHHDRVLLTKRCGGDHLSTIGFGVACDEAHEYSQEHHCVGAEIHELSNPRICIGCKTIQTPIAHQHKEAIMPMKPRLATANSVGSEVRVSDSGDRSARDHMSVRDTNNPTPKMHN